MTKLSLIALLSVATALPAAAQRYNGQVSFTPAQVKAAADSVRLNLGVVLDGVRLGSRTLVTLTPRLVSQDGTQTYTFSPVSFGGRNRDIIWWWTNKCKAVQDVKKVRCATIFSNAS